MEGGKPISEAVAQAAKDAGADIWYVPAPLTFKQERETEFRDTVVTLLLDNSGSMRGRPITVAAMPQTTTAAKSSSPLIACHRTPLNRFPASKGMNPRKAR